MDDLEVADYLCVTNAYVVIIRVLYIASMYATTGILLEYSRPVVTNCYLHL